MRLSYAREGTALKILDTNDYYPFGMNFLANALIGESVFNPQASPLNYKYSSKELQKFGEFNSLKLKFSKIGSRFYV